MIVSGFTQKRSFPEDQPVEMEGQHSHCMRCCRSACTKFADQVTACEMVSCELCGWRCHRCKQTEHVLSCPEERVACVNKEYGCPHMVKRSRMATHLPVCPASVVCCSEEWSRWPMHTREQGARLPLPQTKTYIDCGQLDIGLAMRDQRMLIDSLRAPKKLRRTLRNSLIQKYPAAPLTPHNRSDESDVAECSDTSHTVSDDESDAPWDLTKPPPGLRESIRSKLFHVSKETTDMLAAALNKSTSSLSSSHGKLSGNDPLEEASYNPVQPSGVNFRSSSLPPDHVFSNQATNDSGAKPITDSSASQAHHIQNEISEEKKDIRPALSTNTTMCQSSATSETSSAMAGCEEQRLTNATSIERSVRSSVSSDRVSDVSSRSRSTLQDIGGTQLHRLLGQEGGAGDGENGSEQDEGATSEICLHKLLGVNIGFECINKYVYKAPSMYNFICAQNFRRDQYLWHFKNVHQDIYQGSQGWMEQRCPLAYMGCTFSFLRFEPAQPGMEVYYSWLQESFGLRSTTSPEQFDGFSSAQTTHNPSAQATAMATSAQTQLKEVNSSSIQRSSSCDEETSNISQSNFSPNYNLQDEGKTEVTVNPEPSLSNLALVDKDFDLVSKNSNMNCEDRLDVKAIQQVELSEELNSNKGAFTQTNESKHEISEESGCIPESNDLDTGPRLRMCVRPTIFTAMNWDSKVLFEYEVEEDEENKRLEAQLNISDLPFELLQNIAKHLDSFSLCNLALTSRGLRDVCCSLLDEYGIVVLNWQRLKTGNDVSWKVVNKRWMFSTSFEPIRSWRFKQNVPHMGDHLKVCPYNKDIVQHTGRVQVMHL